MQRKELAKRVKELGGLQQVKNAKVYDACDGGPGSFWLVEFPPMPGSKEPTLLWVLYAGEDCVGPPTVEFVRQIDQAEKQELLS